MRCHFLRTAGAGTYLYRYGLKRLFLEGYGTTEDVACGSVIEKVNIVIISSYFFNVGVTLGS